MLAISTAIFIELMLKPLLSFIYCTDGMKIKLPIYYQAKFRKCINNKFNGINTKAELRNFPFLHEQMDLDDGYVRRDTLFFFLNNKLFCAKTSLLKHMTIMSHQMM